MANVFLSYASKDIELAEKLEQVLTEGGYSVWRDQVSIYGGQNWLKAIGEAILDHDFIILIWSKHATQSHFVEFERSKRAKQLNISIQPFLGIRVAIPIGVDFKEAESVVIAKKAWIKKHSVRMRAVEKGNKRSNGQSIEKMRRKAKEKLIPRLTYLANKHNLPFRKVTIRNQKTRLGSCSQANNINLNMKLIRLPSELIDYVLLHELVHTKVKNHSKRYWNELKQLVPNTKEYIKQLRTYQIGI